MAKSIGPLALAAALACAPAPGRCAGSQRPAGLYVWGEAVEMTDGRADRGEPDSDAQDRLLRACLEGPLRIRRLHFLADPGSWDAGSVDRLLRAAAAAGIEVYAVPPGGMQDAWAGPFLRTGRADPRPVLAWVRSVLARGAPGAKFAGVQLDVEPHRARARRLLLFRPTAWDERGGGLSGSPRNRAIASEYLALLDAVRAELSRIEPRPRLAATIPTWLDGEDLSSPDGNGGESWARLVQSRADFVTLMDYVGRGGESGAARAAEAIESEIAAGPVEILLETASPGMRRGAPRRGETLYGGGEAGLLDVVRRLEERFAGHPNFLGCAVHHYRNAYGSGAPGWPPHGGGSREGRH